MNNSVQNSNSADNSSTFSCKCNRVAGVSFACEKAYTWIRSLQHSDIGRLKDLYWDLLGVTELNEYEDQIGKDLNRTFPKCPQF